MGEDGRGEAGGEGGAPREEGGRRRLFFGFGKEKNDGRGDLKGYVTIAVLLLLRVPSKAKRWVTYCVA